MKCKNCNTDNSDDALYCRHCGKTLRSNNKTIKVFFVLLVIAVMVGVAWWYLFKPNLWIDSDDYKVKFNCEGGSVEIPIYTNADYSQWHVEESYNSFVYVSKDINSIVVKCKENMENSAHSRKCRVGLYCDGINSDTVYIDIEQEESDKYVYAEIIDVSITHNVYAYSSRYYEEKKGLKIMVRCNVRHANGIKMKCAVWFYHENRDKLINEDSPYTTSDHHLTVQEVFYPSDNSDKDIELFIPYSEFPHSEKGVYLEVGIFEYRTDPTSKLIVSKTYKDKSFNISK